MSRDFVVAVSSALLCLSCSGMPVRAADGMMSPGSVYDWTGFYLGTQVGWAWADQELEDNAGLNSTLALKGEFFGPFGGVQKQWNNFVVGAEVEANWSDVDGQDTFTPPGGRTFGGVEIFGSAGIKLGYAWNRFLVYGTGGVSGSERETLQRNGRNSTSDHAASIGWMAGAGADYALTSNVILGLQYRHYDFGESDYSELAFIPERTDSTTQDTITGHLIVKFGGF